MDDIAHLSDLRDEMHRRGWKAELREGRGRKLLRVQHPKVPQLNDDIACTDGEFRWAWGQGIAPAADIANVADRIQFVLREVGA